MIIHSHSTSIIDASVVDSWTMISFRVLECLLEWSGNKLSDSNEAIRNWKNEENDTIPYEGLPALPHLPTQQSKRS